MAYGLTCPLPDLPARKKAKTVKRCTDEFFEKGVTDRKKPKKEKKDFQLSIPDKFKFNNATKTYRRIDYEEVI